MDATDLAALRGVSALASHPGLTLGPFADITAMSRSYENVVLHLHECKYATQRVGFSAAIPVTAADLPALGQVAARLPDARALPLLTVDWCQSCAPYNRPSSEAAHRARGAWLTLALVVAELVIIDEQLEPLLTAAGPDLTWPQPPRRRHRAVFAHRDLAKALQFVVEAHHAHPCVERLTASITTGLDLVGVYSRTMGQESDPYAADLDTCLTWVRERAATQRRVIETLMRSFPLDRLATRPRYPKPDVLVLTRAQVLGEHTGARLASAVTVEAIAWPVATDGDLVVLRVPDTALPDLATPPLGLARVPAGDVAQIAAVAVASAHQQTAQLRWNRDLFEDLVRGATHALA